MRAATLGFLAEHRRARVAPLADHLVATIEARNPGYAATRVVPRADLWRSCHDNIFRVLELLAVALAAASLPEGAGPVPTDPDSHPAYDAARETGRRRAEQGLPLDDVLRSFRMGGRLIWDDLVEQARSTLDGDELREVGTRLWEVVDETSAQVAAAYHATERAAVRADEQLRAELWEGLLNGRAPEPGFAHEAARILDLPVGGSYLVLMVGGGLASDRLEAALAPRPSAWVRRVAGVVGLVHLRDEDPEPVLTLLRDHVDAAGAVDVAGAAGSDAGVSVGVSVVVAGLTGVDTGARQAALALRTLGGRPGVAALDDRLPEALLLSAPEIAGRLVAVWLGPLLGLPDAEREPLLDTLRAWVSTGGSTTGTASLVHCHRNTVLNRLHRIGTLTRRVLLDAAPPLELDLALRALDSGHLR